MSNKKKWLSALIIGLAISFGIEAKADTITGTFLDGLTTVTWSATVDSGITVVQQYYGTTPPPANQGAGTIATFASDTFNGGNPVYLAGGQGSIPSGTFSFTYSGLPANIFLLHFDTQELGLLLSGVTSVFTFTFNDQNGLSGVFGYSTSPVPLPPALFLFGSALVGMTILGRRRRKVGPVAAA